MARNFSVSDSSDAEIWAAAGLCSVRVVPSAQVTLTVEGRKVHADGNGVESPAPLHDSIDVGVFSGKKGQEKPLALRKEWITGGRQSFEFNVKDRPTRAGIDPYNKLIDRNKDDNTIDVSTP